MRNLYIAVIFCLCSPVLSSQVMITELCFDTPYSERFNESYNVGQHHLGEYIELYNYTTEDITLKGWFLADKVSTYRFPDDLVIPSESFILLAYRDLNFNATGNYFPGFFPSTLGKESQIKYQSNIMLRNTSEVICLYMGYVRDKDFKGYPIHMVYYNNPEIVSNESTSAENPATFNFYISSLHLGPGNSQIFYQATATPLSADYVPATRDLEDVETYRDAVLLEYANFTWEENSNAILQATCNLVIPAIEQNPIMNPSNLTHCFNFDVSGNNTGTAICEEEEARSASETSGLEEENHEYSASELEEIGSSIVLYPNPTSSVVNISWDESINGKISQIQVFNTNSIHISSASIGASQTTTLIDLSSQPSGIYLVEFILDTNQSISRNIIKL